MTPSPSIHPLGPNNSGGRGSAQRPVVTAVRGSVARAFGAVGGSGGAAPAPPEY
jgi:hypothetical protein